VLPDRLDEKVICFPSGEIFGPISSRDELTTFRACACGRERSTRLEELPYIFLRCPQLSFGQRFSLQTKNAVLTPAVSQIHSHRQTISIGANCVSPAIFFCARRHRRRIQFSRQLPQDFREYFFRLSLHRAFVRFKVGSLRCQDLLCFFMVDLLFHVIAR
jgi:hypothetical protein